MQTQNNRSLQQIPKQSIILDTCIVRYISNKFIGLNLITYLAELLSRGFDLSVSEVTIYELLSGCTVKQEKEGVAALSLFKTFQISTNVLIAASQLSTLYHCEKIIADDGISMQDKIIASTAILTGSLILSADVNDFPRPFFHEGEEKPIYYRRKDKAEMLIIQILRPNHLVIQKRFAERPMG